MYLTGIRHGGINQASVVMQERTGGQNAAIAGGKTNKQHSSHLIEPDSSFGVRAAGYYSQVL